MVLPPRGLTAPLAPQRQGAPPSARRGAQHSARTMDFIGDLAGWRGGCQGAGTPRVPLQRGGGLRQLPRVCTHTHTQVCTHRRMQSKAPPPLCRHPVPPPVLWGASTVPGKQWGVAGGGRGTFRFVSGLLAPAPPHSLAMQEAGGQAQAGHLTARWWKGCCAWQRVLGVLGGAGVQGHSGCSAHPGVQGWSSMQWASGPTRTHAMQERGGEGGVQALAKTGISPPNSVPGPPTWPWGIPELGCHPRPGRGGRLPFM